MEKLTLKEQDIIKLIVSRYERLDTDYFSEEELDNIGDKLQEEF